MTKDIKMNINKLTEKQLFVAILTALNRMLDWLERFWDERHGKDKKQPVMVKSICCNADVDIDGVGETHWYVCQKCHEPCDLK